MAQGIGGYLGRVLRVDLSREKTSVEPLDDSSLRKFIGGDGQAVTQNPEGIGA